MEDLILSILHVCRNPESSGAGERINNDHDAVDGEIFLDCDDGEIDEDTNNNSSQGVLAKVGLDDEAGLVGRVVKHLADRVAQHNDHNPDMTRTAANNGNDDNDIEPHMEMPYL